MAASANRWLTRSRAIALTSLLIYCSLPEWRCQGGGTGSLKPRIGCSGGALTTGQGVNGDQGDGAVSISGGTAASPEGSRLVFF